MYRDTMENSERLKFLLETASLKTSRPFFSFFYKRFILRKNPLFFRILSVYLLPFTLFYLAAVLFKKILANPEKFDFSVISVGNIVSGGTGKTPLVAAIVKTLAERGRRTAVLSSGAAYSSGTTDEIRMIGKNFPGLLFASKKSEEIRKLALKMDKPGDTAVIDDGFHSFHIHKDVDILVLDILNPFDNNKVIPSGLLREPRSSLKRADAFVLTHPYMAVETKKKELISYLGTFRKPVFIMDYEIECLKNSAGECPSSAIRDKNIIAAAGIGNPLNFFHILLRLSPGRICTAVYPDHFKYRDYDIGELCGLVVREKPDYVICTEKDYVKLEGRFPREIPLFYLKINAVLIDSYGEKIGFDALFPGML